MKKVTEMHLESVTPDNLKLWQKDAFISFASSTGANGNIELGVNGYGLYSIRTRKGENSRKLGFQNAIDAVREYAKLISTVLLILASTQVFSQTTDEDKNTFSLASFMLGYDAKISAPVSGLTFGVRTGNVYLGINSIIPVTSNSLAPKMFSGNIGYNIGSFQPFLGYSFQTIGKESEQYFRGKEGQFLNGWRTVYGLSFYPITMPLKFTFEKQGNQSILSLSIYKSL